MRVAIVDYGMGNLASVSKAVERSGATSSITSDPESLRGADAVILPGVGNFEAGMRNLKRAKLDLALLDHVRKGGRLMGICLGMQLLFDRSEEGDVPGLGLLSGEVIRLSSLVKVPHMGWNALNECEGFFSPYSGKRFYFVHSYECVIDEDLEHATCSYGDEVIAGVRKDRILAFQFHPEKSSSHGLEILAAGLREIAV